MKINTWTRRILALILFIGVLGALAACGTPQKLVPQTEAATTIEKTTANTTQATTIAATEAAVPEGYGLLIDGILLRPEGKASEASAVLDLANETGEAPSCVFEGLDKVYRFDGFDVQTALIDEEEIITGVIILDDRVATPEGLEVGMNLDDLESRYGTDYVEDFGQYIYEDEAARFIVILSFEDEIVSISYIGKFED